MTFSTGYLMNLVLWFVAGPPIGMVDCVMRYIEHPRDASLPFGQQEEKPPKLPRV